MRCCGRAMCHRCWTEYWYNHDQYRLDSLECFRCCTDVNIQRVPLYQPARSAPRVSGPVVIDLCSSSDDDESSSGDDSSSDGGEMIITPLAAPPAATKSAAAVEDDAEKMMDAAVALHELSFGELPPLSEQEREWMKGMMEELLFDADDAPPSPAKPAPPSPAKPVQSPVKAAAQVSPARRQEAASDSMMSTDGITEDEVTEVLGDAELSEIAGESDDDDEDALDEQERAELLEFVRNLPSKRISRRQQRLVRASLRTWHFEYS